jgi:hypothetical protein
VAKKSAGGYVKLALEKSLLINPLKVIKIIREGKVHD